MSAVSAGARPPERTDTLKVGDSPQPEVSAELNAASPKPKEQDSKISTPFWESANQGYESSRNEPPAVIKSTGILSRLWKLIKWTAIAAAVLLLALLALGAYLSHQNETNQTRDGGQLDGDANGAGEKKAAETGLSDTGKNVATDASNAAVGSGVVPANEPRRAESGDANTKVAATPDIPASSADTAPTNTEYAPTATATSPATDAPLDQTGATPASDDAVAGAARPAQTSTVNGVTISGAFEKRCGWIKNEMPARLTLTDRSGTWQIVSPGKRADGSDKVPSYGSGLSCGCIIAESNRAQMLITRILTGTPLPLAKCAQDKALPNLAQQVPQHVYTPPPGPPQSTYVIVPGVPPTLATGYWPRGYQPHN